MKRIAIKKDGEDADEHMTMQDFIWAVESGAFTDDDGYGTYADDKFYFPGLKVFPSDIVMGKLDESHSHIVWFNR